MGVSHPLAAIALAIAASPVEYLGQCEGRQILDKLLGLSGGVGEGFCYDLVGVFIDDVADAV